MIKTYRYVKLCDVATPTNMDPFKEMKRILLRCLIQDVPVLELSWVYHDDVAKRSPDCGGSGLWLFHESNRKVKNSGKIMRSDGDSDIKESKKR